MAFGFLKKLRGNKDKAGKGEAVPAEEEAAPPAEAAAAAADATEAVAGDGGEVVAEHATGEGSAVDAGDGDASHEVPSEVALNASTDSHFVPVSAVPQILEGATVEVVPVGPNAVPPMADSVLLPPQPQPLSRTGSVASLQSSRGAPPSTGSRKGPRKSPPSSLAGSHTSKGPSKMLMKKVHKGAVKSPSAKAKAKVPAPAASPPPARPPPTNKGTADSKTHTADDATQEITPSPARNRLDAPPPGPPDGPTSMHITEEDVTAKEPPRGALRLTVSSDDDESDGPTFVPSSPATTQQRPASPPRVEVTPATPASKVGPSSPKQVPPQTPPPAAASSPPPHEDEYDYEDYGEEEEEVSVQPTKGRSSGGGTGSKVAKLVVAERFLGLLAPRQFSGKVLKLKNVVVLDDGIEDEVANNTVWLQREGNRRLLYDEVQMVPSDATEVDSSGLAETQMSMVVVDNHENGYVESERDAIKLLAAEGSVNSVYVIDKQAVMAKESAIRTVASLVVVWRPHSSPSEEYNCATHRKPMELYDPITRDVACALCSASEGRRMLVLSEVVSPHLQAEVNKVLTAKHEGTLAALRKQAAQHQRLTRAQQRAIEQINSQFDAIAAAVEAKRQEVLDDLYSETSGDIRDLSDGIHTNLHTMQLLDAAHSSLRTTEALLPPQLATIASALKAPSATPPTNSKPMKIALNMEGVVNELNAVAYLIAVDERQQAESPSAARMRGGVSTPLRRGASPTKRSAAPVVSKLVSEDTLSLAASQPGTSLFNFPLQTELESSKGVEFRLRVDDGGDWLGVGVGVGGSLESWAEGSVFDLHHLWVVPPGSPRLLVVRLTRMGNGNVKLTVHDRGGRQLDDGRIPHWNVKRSCFPQVSFGGRHGKVVMVSAPSRL